MSWRRIALLGPPVLAKEHKQSYLRRKPALFTSLPETFCGRKWRVVPPSVKPQENGWTKETWFLTVSSST